MRPLNICLVSLSIYPDSPDGEARVFASLFKYLKGKGHNVKLITAKWNVDLNDPDIIQVDLITKRFFWVPQFNLKVTKFLRAHNFDIIHGNGPKGTLPIILANKKKFISTIHDLGPFETPFTKIPLEKFLIKFVVKRATKITTVTDFIKKEMKLYMPNTDIDKIYNIYNGIEEKYKPYPKEAQQLKEKLGIKGPIMLYIGRIAKYKDVGNIIAAYKKVKLKIPNLNLVIGGKPDFYMAKQYQEWKEKNKDVYFLGFISDEEIPIYYSMGDLFVTYSYASEGFGLTPIESIACGTPVICSEMLAYKEVLQDNAIFVPPQNPDLLAEAILNYFKNENIKENMITKAQEFIKRYSWDEVGKKLEKIYYDYISQN